MIPCCLRTTILVAAVGLPSAAAVIGISSLAAMGSNDSVAWQQLSPAFTPLGSAVQAFSDGGMNVAGASSAFECLEEGNGWTGDFTLGDALLWNMDSGAPMTFAFAHPVKGGGAQIQGDLLGEFSATISAYNGASLLGSYTVNATNNGNEDGSAPFIGIVSSTADITKLVFSESSAGGPTNEFAIDTLQLNSAPEPKSLALAGVALVLLLICGYRRRKNELAG